MEGLHVTRHRISLVQYPCKFQVSQSRHLVGKVKGTVRVANKLADHFTPNLKFMVSPFLIIKQCKLLNKQLGSVLHIICPFNEMFRAIGAPGL